MNSAEGIDIQAEDPRATEQEGRERITAGRLREAIRIFHRLTRQFPERLDLHAQLGYLALLANDLETSIAHLARAINLGLKTRDSLAHLAEAYYRKGRLGSSAYCYQRLGRDGLAGTLAVLSKLETYRLTDGCLPAEIPWVAHHPLPVVGARINGRDANLVLATGAGDTVLDTQFAIDAEARLGGKSAGRLPADCRHWLPTATPNGYRCITLVFRISRCR